MEKVIVRYLSKRRLYPGFGKYHYGRNLIWVRRDLPKPAKAFVLEHEMGHHRGHGEILATLYAIPKHPWGFVVTAVMSLAPYRLRFYWRRIFG